MVDFAFISGSFVHWDNLTLNPSYIGSPLPQVQASDLLGWYMFAGDGQDPLGAQGNYIQSMYILPRGPTIIGSITGNTTGRNYHTYKMTPNTLTVEPGYTYKSGSTRIRVNGRSPLFSYWNNYNNGIGAFPQVNQKLYIDGVTTQFDNTIANVTGGWENGVWVADITLAAPLPQDVNSNTNKYVYIVPNGILDNLSVTPAAGSTLPDLNGPAPGVYTPSSVEKTESGYESSGSPNGSPMLINTVNDGYLALGSYNVFSNGVLNTTTGVTSWYQTQLTPDRLLPQQPQVGWYIKGPFLQPGTKITSVSTVTETYNDRSGSHRLEPVRVTKPNPDYSGVWEVTWDLPALTTSAKINSQAAVLFGNPNLYFVSPTPFTDATTPTTSSATGVSLTQSCNASATLTSDTLTLITAANSSSGIPIPKSTNIAFESIQYGAQNNQAILPSAQGIATSLTQWTGNPSIPDTLLRQANVSPKYWFVWAYTAPGGNQTNYSNFMTFISRPKYLDAATTINPTMDSASNGTYANEYAEVNEGIGVYIAPGNPQFTMLVTPNILTIKKGTVIGQGSTTLIVNSHNPMFDIYGFRNGKGIYPKVGNKLVFEGIPGTCNIVDVLGHKTLTGWTATITVDIAVSKDYTAGDASYVYTWDPNNPPDFDAEPVVEFPPFQYMWIRSDAPNAVYATDTTTLGPVYYNGGATDLMIDWDRNSGKDSLITRGWYLFGYDLDNNPQPYTGTYTHMTSELSDVYVPQALVDYNTTGSIMVTNDITDWYSTSGTRAPVGDNIDISTPLGQHIDITKNNLYFCPNTLTIQPGSYKQGTLTFTLLSDSPLLTYLGSQDSYGDLPQVGDGFVAAFLDQATTIVGVGNYKTTASGWSIDVTIGVGAKSDFNTSTYGYNIAYTWDLPVKQILGQQVNSGGTVVETPPATSTVVGAPIISGTVSAGSLTNVANFYNNAYPGFNFYYTENDTPNSTVTIGTVNKFLADMGNCNFGWNGASALPSKITYGPDDTVVDMQFRVPQRLFQDRTGLAFYNTGNNSDTNKLVIPPGCQFLFVQWLMGAGGGGGAADGSHETGGDWNNGMAYGGGSGAYVQNTWISVKEGDVVTFYIGNAGAGTWNWGLDGEASTMKIYRPSDNKTYLAFSMGGGVGGNCNGDGEYSRDVNIAGIGGVVIKSVGNNNHNGNNSTREGNGHGAKHTSNESDGRPGADSPLGKAGYNSNASGYGAGGGGAWFHDGSHSHWSSGRAMGGSGSPGYGNISLTMYGPTDGSPVYDVCVPANAI